LILRFDACFHFHFDPVAELDSLDDFREPFEAAQSSPAAFSGLPELVDHGEHAVARGSGHHGPACRAAPRNRGIVPSPHRKQLGTEAAGDEAPGHVEQPVHHQQPHGREVPKQRAREPAAERKRTRELEPEDRRGVVDLQPLVTMMRTARALCTS
jgi:hypothetical protein